MKGAAEASARSCELPGEAREHALIVTLSRVGANHPAHARLSGIRLLPQNALVPTRARLAPSRLPPYVPSSPRLPNTPQQGVDI
jgi:hypothetical protein